MTITSGIRSGVRSGVRAGGYPRTALATRNAFGWGTWSAGYLFNAASGATPAVFGSPTSLAANASPTYRQPGPLGSSDYAVLLDAANEGFFASAPAVGTNDLAVAMVCRLSSFDTGDFVRLTYANTLSGSDSGWIFDCSAPNDFRFRALTAGSPIGLVTVPYANMPQNEWVVLAGVAERGTGKIRAALRGLFSGAEYASAEGTLGAGSMSSGGNVFFGGYASGGATLEIAAGYLAIGAGAAAGLSANLPAALRNFASFILT